MADLDRNGRELKAGDAVTLRGTLKAVAGLEGKNGVNCHVIIDGGTSESGDEYRKLDVAMSTRALELPLPTQSAPPMQAIWDVDFSLLDWDGLAASITDIAKNLANCTPGTQLDDLAATYLGQVLADLLKPKPMGVTQFGTVSDDAIIDHVAAEFAAKGMTAPSGKWLGLLVQIIKVVGPIFLPVL